MHCHIAPLGIPTLVIAHDPAVASTAEAAYAEWRLDPPFPKPRIRLTLERSDSSSDNVGAGIRVDGSLMTIEAGIMSGFADGRTLNASCRVPPHLIGDPAALATEATDTLLLFLLNHCDRTPLHAASVMIGDRALVLAGRSGSGKSTLAFTAARCGLRPLAEDVTYVQIEPNLRVWAFHPSIHVLPEDAPPGDHPVRMRSGTLKVVLPLPGRDDGRVAEKASLLLLQRGERVALSRLRVEDALDALFPLDPGFDLFSAETERAIRALSENGVWRLTLSRDPREAIELLREHFSDAMARG